ncbi:MAG: hypothetical protein BWY54_00731 [Candidatus Dependentiae bacterium ADurb.Bin331]|nr:MAG: hypothetical protein BWY54_00731 [Candidatus Dependentiae bacterium ADurb.Bin331]
MKRNFVLALLVSSMLVVGSTIFAGTEQGSTEQSEKIEKKDNDNKPASTFSLQTVWNSIKAKSSDVTTHVCAHKYAYGIGVTALIGAYCIYKAYFTENEEEDAPTTMRRANYNTSR